MVSWWHWVLIWLISGPTICMIYIRLIQDKWEKSDVEAMPFACILGPGCLIIVTLCEIEKRVPKNFRLVDLLLKEIHFRKKPVVAKTTHHGNCP